VSKPVNSDTRPTSHTGPLAIPSTPPPRYHPRTGTGDGGGDGWWQFAEAATLFKEAVAFREAHLPPDHPSTATTMSNLASTYSSLGQLDEVPPGRHRRCLPATQWYDALGDIVDALGDIMSSLSGKILDLFSIRLPKSGADNSKRIMSPQPVYCRRRPRCSQRSLHSAAGLHGRPRHRLPRVATHYDVVGDIGTSCWGLGWIFQEGGATNSKRTVGKEHWGPERARPRRCRMLPGGHPDIATSLNNLAGAYHRQGRVGPVKVTTSPPSPSRTHTAAQHTHCPCTCNTSVHIRGAAWPG
jgi:hypothetical protein